MHVYCQGRGITNEFRAQNAITRCTGLAVRNLHNNYYRLASEATQLGLKQPLSFNSVRALSGGRRGGGVFSGETSGGSSHWGDWRGGSVLSATRGKATAVSRAGSENSETTPSHAYIHMR